MGLSAAEQYGIELLNRARMDPSKEAALQKIGLNQGSMPGPISSAPKQVLAPSAQLQVAAEKHSSYMLRVDSFAHDDIGDGTPTSRIKATGFWGSASQIYAENINYASVGYSKTLEGLTAVQHGMLFDSAGHRYNLLSGWVNEVGYGLAQGDFGGNKVSMVTQVFGARAATYVTGVVYADKNGNKFYNIGEGRQGLAFALEGGRMVKAAAAGGYALRVTPADDTRVEIGGGRVAVVEIDTLNGRNGFNAKLDVVSNNLLLVSTSTALISGSIRDIKALGISALNLTGSESNNRLWGNIANNVLSGAGGQDTLYGGSGNDRLYGGEGHDSLLGQDGNDVLSGDAGNDTLDGGNGTSTLNGGDGDDRLLGQKGHDLLKGDAGNDTLFGNLGNDTMFGGDGNDNLQGQDGNDSIEGDAGEDTLFGGNGNDKLEGGSENDTLKGDAGNDTLEGGAGDDSLDGGTGHDLIRGGADSDTLMGDSGNDTLYGDAGDDRLDGEDGDDFLYGGAGNDVLTGGTGDNQLFGGDHDDDLQGGAGADTLDGGNGSDVLSGDEGHDQLNGGAGHDSLLGDAGSDTLNGGAGNDTLTGGDAADTFVFGDSNDQIQDQDEMTDFDEEFDILQIAASNLDGAESFGAWIDQGGVAEQVQQDLVLTFEFGDTLTIRNITLEELLTATIQILP
jgi:Ca2+-binding RTX toxin-like protein